ncbi:hypothetical protein [Caminicella sporogenes]|uniref:hypothetical protein n=1 Tax=Caminicella sporogenes TaxID=166485 RepID=UPI00254212B2|nr:hypothetical protein [Caminicella sporogenes]WIF95144.1 hypothetical protein QNI18_00450 [Caminicella sporogenes]
MNKRIRKKVFTRACNKIMKGQELTHLESKVLVQMTNKSTINIPKLIKSLRKSIIEVSKQIRKIVNNPEIQKKLKELQMIQNKAK